MVIEKEATPPIQNNNNGKTSSIIMIRPLEGINKEIVYKQRLNRPFKVIQNLPISKQAEPIDYSKLTKSLSVKDSGILYNSLIVSRFNWLNHVFKTYWTRREQNLIGLKNSNKKDRMIKFCDLNLNCAGMHDFKVKFYFLKDDEREKQYQLEVETKRLERLKRKQEKAEELKRKKEEKEKEEKEKELRKEQLRIEYETKLQNEAKLKLQQQEELKKQQEQEQEKQQTQQEKQQTQQEKQQTQQEKTQIQQEEQQTQDKQQPQEKQQEEKPLANESNKSSEQSGKQEVSGQQETPKPNILDAPIIMPSAPAIPATTVPKPIEIKQATTNSAKKDNSITFKATNKPITKLNPATPTHAATASSSTSSSLPSTSTSTKDIMSNPESAIMIHNLNLLAKNDLHLKNLMKEVAGGQADTEKILEFQNYIQKAKNMGDATGYMNKLKRKQESKLSKKNENGNNVNNIKPNIIKLTPEEIKKRNDELTKRANEIKAEQERVKLEKIKAREEKERLRKERMEQKIKEREERERLKKQAKEEREREREIRLKEKLAEKERIRLEREEKAKEKLLQKQNNLIKNEQKKANSTNTDRNNSDSDLDSDDDDRMGKLNNDDSNDDLWNTKLSPLQERYSTGASLVFEFNENNASRFILPRNTIYELIDNEDEEDEVNAQDQIKVENSANATPLPKSPYVTIIASFILVHNQGEIDGWERRMNEIKQENEKKQNNVKEEENENSNSRKRRRKKGSSWGSTAANKRATRASKQAREMEILRNEEEDYHEEDNELNEVTEDNKPIPVYSCVSIILNKIPFRFTNFILNSGNSLEHCQNYMREIMNIGKRIELNQLWYQIDGLRDELLGETLRYNLNRLDYAECGGRKSKIEFQKKFGKGGRN